MTNPLQPSEALHLGRGQYFSPALKFHRQCPLVPLAEDQALGSEGGKVLGSGLCCEQSREVEMELYCVRSGF
jgi:hypothetical protein